MQPRIFIEEMDLQVPCSVEAFMARNATECLLDPGSDHKMRVSQVFDALFQHEWSLEVMVVSGQMTPLLLFVLVLGLMQRLWLLHYSPFREENIGLLSRALGRWKQVWDRQVAALTVQQLDQNGFTKNAAVEFWQLGDTLLKSGKTRIAEFGPQNPALGVKESSQAYHSLRAVEESRMR